MATKTKPQETNGQTNRIANLDGGALGLVIPAPNVQVAKVKIRGTAPLIVHAWSEKARRMIEDKQQKKAKGPKEARDPKADFESALYVAEEGWYGVPACAFKAALVGAARQVDGLSMVMAKRTFFVLGDGKSKGGGHELTRIIHNNPPRMRTDMVRLESGVADVRYRPEFDPWSATLTVRFNAGLLSAEQLLNLIALAGSWEGICEWRPSAPNSATGSYGTFEVVSDE